MTTRLPGHLVETLDALDYSGVDGLVSAGEPPETGPRGYLWQELEDRVGLDAVFFYDGVPLVGFTGATEPEGLLGLRHRLWNYGRVPLLVADDSDSITVFNAAGLSSEEGESQEIILDSVRRSATAHGLLQAFSRSEVESGAFAREYADSYRNSTRVDTALLRNLSYLRTTLTGDDALRKDAIDAMIGGCLLASYMADRGVLDSEHMLMLSGATDLNSVLTNGVEQTRRLFRGLANRFNGDVFDTLANQLQRIRRSDLRDMAAVLRGDDLPTGQGSLWPYDFSVLPADLVSSVYEQLLEDTRKSDAAYYTPRFLVDLTLDEVLAWQGELPEIVDLACGSGAFMTEAFRRLAYRVRVSKGKSQLSYSELRDLLVRHIYGVDSNLSAARIAIFGLYLALLEEIDPPTVWASVVLPKLLNANVVVSDAFAEHPLRRRRFDVVVSNPPWSSKLTEDAALFLKEHNAPVSDRQSAQAFLWLATDMLRPGGTFGLVMPAKPLLHNRSYTAHEFRSALFRDVRVRSIVDLSAMRREIFAAATAPSAVIVAETPTSDEEDSQSFDILHIAAHPRAQGRAIDALVVTPEEVRTVDSRQAIARPDVWRTMLWGGPRDLELLDRLRGRFPSLDEVTRQQQWASGQGYQVGGGDANSAEDLHGLPIVETKFVHPLRILAPSGFEEFRRDYLHRPRDPALYEGPHVLVRRTLVGGRLAATLLDEDAVFPNGVIGFAGPSRDRTLLMTLAAAIVSSLGHYWHFMTSASWGVERDFVEVNEHAALPLAEPTSSQAKALARVVSRAQGGLDEGLREELDELIFSIYGLSDSERERVRRQAVQAIGRFRRPAQYDREISDRDLSQYVRILRNTLRDTLGTLNVEAQRFKAGRYRAVSVTLADFTEEQSAPRRAAISSDDIAEIVRSRVVRGAGTTGVVAQPAGFFVDEDTIYIVKTADADRWSVDASLDDAGRIFSALAFGA